MRYALVYQGGIANVFQVDDGCEQVARILQHAYDACEWFCRGIKWSGGKVNVYHCDLAGDIADADWNVGPGELWRDQKNPPV